VDRPISAVDIGKADIRQSMQAWRDKALMQESFLGGDLESLKDG